MVMVMGDEDGGIMCQKITGRNIIKDKDTLLNNTVSKGYCMTFETPFARMRTVP